MKLLIVDDEALVRQGTHDTLEALFPGQFEYAFAEGVADGREKIKAEKPNIVFLDVQMADGTGIDLLNSLDEKPFELIFLTAFSDYAVQAFEQQATNYLLKPLNSKKVRAAVEQAMEKLRSKAKLDYLTMQAAPARPVQPATDARLSLPTQEGIRYMRFNQIRYVQADSSYSRFFVLDLPKPILVSKTLNHFKAQLMEQGFVQIHRSYIINLNMVESYLRTNRGFVRMDNGEELPLGASYKLSLIHI